MNGQTGLTPGFQLTLLVQVREAVVISGEPLLAVSAATMNNPISLDMKRGDSEPPHVFGYPRDGNASLFDDAVVGPAFLLPK